MSPTVFRFKGYRLYFLSNEEMRKHIHIECERGEAKFWLEPTVSLAAFGKLSVKELTEIQKVVEKRKDEIIKKWKKHFSISGKYNS